VREVPCFVCFDMASPARVVWVVVRSSLVFFAAVAWLAFHPFPLERAARSSIVRSAAQPAAAQLDHIMLVTGRKTAHRRQRDLLAGGGLCLSRRRGGPLAQA
jgi:hypothetical protein